VVDDPASRDTPDDSRGNAAGGTDSGGNATGGTDAELSHLREILVGPERKELAHLQSRVDRLGFTPERLADELPAAIFRRTDRGDRQLAIALAPSVEQALGESVRRHPRMIATAIFPVLGPAIRKAIAQALSGLVASVNAGIGQTFSWRGLKWRLEAWRTGVPFAQVVISHSMLYRVEQVLLIHAESGLLLAHVSSPDLVATDGDLISGMMTAIRDFVGDSFAAEREVGGLTSFKVGELEVHVEPGPQAILAAVVRGPAPQPLLERLRETIESIHLRFAGALVAFHGDTAPFEPSKDLLDDLLETVLQNDPRIIKRITWWPWVLAFVLLMALLAFVQWRRGNAWERVVTRLEAEPGIVVVKADQGWRRSRLSGMRDPLAARPAAMLAALGTDTTRIDGQWQPYVSLDSSVVIERARRQLRAPATVTLALRGDTLQAGGSAPMAWVVDVGDLRMFPPGVSHIAVNEVETQLPERVSAGIAIIEQRRVLFAIASSRLSPLAQVTIDSTASELLAMDSSLRVVGRHLELELAGRADATGLDSTNQSLSADRAENVRRALIRSGVSETAVSTRAFGSGVPLAVADTTARARVNRSVSFVVRVARSERSTIPR